MLERGPTAEISSGLGSSSEAACCVERRLFCPPASASSSARTLASRPTINGVIWCGKITMPRTGIIGTRFISCFSRVNIQSPGFCSGGSGAAAHQNGSPSGLSGLLQQTPIDLAGADHVRRDHEVAHLPLHGKVVHQFQHEVFEDHTRSE